MCTANPEDAAVFLNLEKNRRFSGRLTDESGKRKPAQGGWRPGALYRDEDSAEYLNWEKQEGVASPHFSPPGC
jgi:hypothetical protein